MPLQPHNRIRQQTVEKPVADESKESTKGLPRQARVPDDVAHCDRIHRIVPGNGQDAFAVGHERVLALSHDAKAGFLESTNGIEMIDAG
jgi:hypothetical protein